MTVLKSNDRSPEIKNPKTIANIYATPIPFTAKPQMGTGAVMVVEWTLMTVPKSIDLSLETKKKPIADI